MRIWAGCIPTSSSLIRRGMVHPAGTQVRLDKIKQETAVHVQEIVAEGELEVTKLHQQKMAVLAEKRAQATKTASELKANVDVFEKTRMSEVLRHVDRTS